MSQPLRVLIVEASAGAADVLVCALRAGGYEVVPRRVGVADELTAALGTGLWDLVLAGDGPEPLSAAAALDVVRRSGRDVPFILVTGSVGEEVAAAAMRAGVSDYVPRG